MRRIMLGLVVFFSTMINADTGNNAKVADDQATVIAIIDDIARGWEQADGTPFRKHFLNSERSRFIESGGQNVGLADLIDNHVTPEGDALDGLTLDFSNVEVHFEDGFAWAIANVGVKATVKKSGNKIDNNGFQTFLFRAVNNVWKVVHTHSSSRPVKPEDKAHSH
ncbi:MAG: nuclear transport factor 2 family protein [Gammaproteobacteria bacterium]|nr:nuclear transport factor 2 family protein [Gammaproteobacteria bacterium]